LVIFKNPKCTAAHLRSSRGTLVCRGAQFVNHCFSRSGQHGRADCLATLRAPSGVASPEIWGDKHFGGEKYFVLSE